MLKVAMTVVKNCKNSLIGYITFAVVASAKLHAADWFEIFEGSSGFGVFYAASLDIPESPA